MELDATRTFTQPEMAIMMYQEFPEDFLVVPTRDQVKNALAWARSKAEYLSQSPIAQIMPYFDRYAEYIKGDEIVEKDAALLSSLLSKSKRKIAVFSDLHIPFHDEVKLQKAIELNRAADALVIAGDVMEFYNTSRWRKRKYVPNLVEFDNTVRVLEYLSKIFPVIIVMPGNHDNRATKKLHDIVPSELFWLLEDDDALAMLTRPFKNVFYNPDWYYQIGDALIAHAERSSTIEGKPGILLAEYFLPGGKGWGSRLNLGEIRCFITGHTHQISAGYRENLKTLEAGSFCQVLEYTTDSSIVMRPPQTGFVTLVQENGRTDFNLTREYIL
jgi:predicted phosphodiesterase